MGLADELAIRLLATFPSVYRPVFVKTVLGARDNRIQRVKRLKEIALASLVLAHERRDPIGIDPAGVNDVTVILDLKAPKFIPSPTCSVYDRMARQKIRIKSQTQLNRRRSCGWPAVGED
ncbi:hypothetical protein [Mesorhizobium sp.]|uniref:hypothetical protein n=1 Tax=Mesorhizobium sp. TaxID=1871066 RepID=UPI0025CEC80B|nr:hypothetical protein [Mesorhizobium sp.]